jgi:two-component system nitrogen regulation response regulator NtrX
MSAILIIDDEPGIRNTLSSVLEDEKYKVFAAEDAPSGIEILKRNVIDLIFLDVLLPKMGGIEALEKIKAEWTHVEIIMISGHANIDMAVRAVKLGAFDFLEKPLSLEKILTVCRNARSIIKLREENKKLKRISGFSSEEIIGTSAAVRDIREVVKQAANSDARILITGENGSGKEVIARAIHAGSGRADYPFVDVNCAAIPETLIESELFGHEKGDDQVRAAHRTARASGPRNADRQPAGHLQRGLPVQPEVLSEHGQYRLRTVEAAAETFCGLVRFAFHDIFHIRTVHHHTSAAARARRRSIVIVL